MIVLRSVCFLHLENGLIDFDEFLKMMENRAQKHSQDAEMRALFTAFDKDHSGFIDKAELKNTMKEVGFELSDKDVENMMKVAGVALKDRIFYEGMSMIENNIFLFSLQFYIVKN